MIDPLDPGVLVATIKAFLRVRQAESALRRSNEDLERFAYRVTHELNEPLRTITMHAQLLERGLAAKLTPDGLKSVEFIEEGVQRMRAFIDDLLRYWQATHAGSDVRPLDMDAVLSQAVSSLGAPFRKVERRLPTILCPC